MSSLMDVLEAGDKFLTMRPDGTPLVWIVRSDGQVEETAGISDD